MEEITSKLIEKAASGDQDAITQLYELTYSSIYKTVKALIRDEDTVLDVVQDSYIKGFQSLEQLETPELFKAWMKRIAINKSKDYLKKKKPVLFSEMTSENEDEIDFQDEHLDHLPEEVIDQKETTRLMNEILDTLSEEQRMVIGMFYYEEMSVREIAETLGCSENTIKSRLNYGRKKVEIKVKELEKRGTKLYSLAPLSFLVLLFRLDAQAAEMPSRKILDAVTTACTTSGAKAGAAGSTAKAGVSAASRGAAKIATDTAVKGLTTKIVAGVLAVSLVGGGTAMTVIRHQKNSQETHAVDNTVATEQVVPDIPVDTEPVDTELGSNDRSIYDEILADFTKRFQNQEGPSDGRGGAYGYYDLNADGQDEFIITEVIEDENYNAIPSYAVGIYTVIQGQPVQVAEGWSRNRYSIYENGMILNDGSNDSADSFETVLQLTSDGELVEAGISPDTLTDLAQIDYTILQLGETITAPEESASSTYNEDMLYELFYASQVPDFEYESRPDHFKERFNNLGEGIIEHIVYRTDGVHELEFYFKLYDIDGDGGEELLFASGYAPWHLTVQAVYKTQQDPIVGTALSAYSFPYDDGTDPQNSTWTYLSEENIQ